MGRKPSIQTTTSKKRNYDPSPNIFVFKVIKKQMVKPAEGWFVLRPTGAAERREEESPASGYRGVRSGPVSPPRLLLQN